MSGVNFFQNEVVVYKQQYGVKSAICGPINYRINYLVRRKTSILKYFRHSKDLEELIVGDLWRYAGFCLTK